MIFFLLGLCKELLSCGQNLRHELFESKDKRSHQAGNKRYDTVHMASSGISIEHIQGHEWSLCGNWLIMFKTI
jgi:hypothetical protein